MKKFLKNNKSVIFFLIILIGSSWLAKKVHIRILEEAKQELIKSGVCK